nr:putative integron gene cassette protein [uncultured bacterium]CAP48125.1 putative integron gene cassette protein [uncultured bacterium]
MQFIGFGWQRSSDKFSARCGFGDIAGRAQTSHALRSPASEASLSFIQFPALHAVTSDSPQLKVRGARSGIWASAFRQAGQGFTLPGFLPA